MPLAIFFDLFNPGRIAAHPAGVIVTLILLGFQIWMFVDALRREEWIWAVFIFFFSALTALLYYFFVYRQQGPVSGSSGGGSRFKGFEFPGAKTRRRIRELQARIHHLDHARDHLDLGDVHMEQGKLTDAEKCYRAALERDPTDPDIQAHLGHCLLQQKRWQEALSLLEKVTGEDPRHDYGHTMMSLAECQAALGQVEPALQSWRHVLRHNAYARARVQYAELLATQGDRETARREFQEVIDDDQHAPKFQKDRDRAWVQRARSGLQRT